MEIKYKYKLGIFIFIGALVFTACENEIGKIEEKKILRSVKYMTIESAKEGRKHSYSGTSKAFHEVSLSFRVGGIVNNVSVAVGDSLKIGATIATLEKISYELEVEKARLSLAQAESDRRNNESKYNRQKRLYENKHVSKKDLDAARALVEFSRSQVLLSKKSLKLTQLDLSYTILKSTEDCLVAEVFKDVNENVKAGENIIAVNCGEGSEVEVLMPENIINNIEKNMLAKVIFDSIPNTIFDAKVSEVSVSSALGAAYPVTLTVDNNKGHRLRSGLSAEVTFTFKASKNLVGIYVPLICVGEDTLGRYVYIVEETPIEGESIIRRQEVIVGDLNSLGVQIIKGLKPKQKIVTAGMSVIRDGLIVKSE